MRGQPYFIYAPETPALKTKPVPYVGSGKGDLAISFSVAVELSAARDFVHLSVRKLGHVLLAIRYVVHADLHWLLNRSFCVFDEATVCERVRLLRGWHQHRKWQGLVRHVHSTLTSHASQRFSLARARGGAPELPAKREIRWCKPDRRKGSRREGSDSDAGMNCPRAPRRLQSRDRLTRHPNAGQR